MRNKNLYNYVVNTLGVTKDFIKEVVEQRVEAVLDRKLHDLFNSGYMEGLILNRITKMVKGNLAYYDDPFDKRVHDIMKDILIDRLNEEYSIEVKALEKEPKVKKVRPARFKKDTK